MTDELDEIFTQIEVRAVRGADIHGHHIQQAKAKLQSLISRKELEARTEEIDKIEDYVFNRERFATSADGYKAAIEMRRMNLASLTEKTEGDNGN